MKQHPSQFYEGEQCWRSEIQSDINCQRVSLFGIWWRALTVHQDSDFRPLTTKKKSQNKPTSFLSSLTFSQSPVSTEVPPSETKQAGAPWGQNPSLSCRCSGEDSYYMVDQLQRCMFHPVICKNILSPVKLLRITQSPVFRYIHQQSSFKKPTIYDNDTCS